MAVVSLSPSAWADAFTASDLNSLASGGLFASTLTAPQIDNSDGSKLFVQFQITLGVLSPVVGANMLAFLIPESTTLNTYVTGSNGTTVADHYRWQNGPYGIIALRQTASTAQIQRSGLVQLAAERYVVGVINRSGVSLAASGNQIAIRTYAQVVA